MQVACGQCGARYDFDAATIPTQGYDAQCTHCGNVFFVSPEEPAPAPAADELLTVACPDCKATYQFPSSSIPDIGYDAQCTQCQTVFFVAKDRAPVPVAAPPVEPPPQSSPTSEPTIEVVEASEVALPVEAEMAIAAPPEPPSAGTGNDPPRDGQDLLSLSSELGEPEPGPSSTEDDFEAISSRRRARVIMGTASAAGVVLVASLMYVLAPVAFDATVGRVLGIKATIHPRAVAHYEAGLPHMWPDTQESYARVVEAMDEALHVDPQYPAALAMRALARTFWSTNLQEEGRRSYDQGTEALAQLKGLSELKRPSADQRAHGEALRAQVAEANDAAGKRFEEAGQIMALAVADIDRALRHYLDQAPVLEVAGIYYANDKDHQARALEVFRRAVEASLGPGKKLDLASPPDPWLPYLQAKIRALETAKGVSPGAVQAFEAAIAHQPSFVRARYELAALYARAGEHEKAKSVLGELAVASSQYPKGQALAAELRAMGAIANVAEPDHTNAAEVRARAPDKPRGAKGRAKRKRGKRRR